MDFEDLTTRQGTMTNAYGHFSLTLGEGRHEIRCSYVGYKTLIETIDLSANQNHDIILQNEAQLDEVVVTTDLNSPLLKTQTGKLSLSQKDIKTEYALMSSPDVIKTLQRTSGVADGMELASGLYAIVSAYSMVPSISGDLSERERHPITSVCVVAGWTSSRVLPLR